LKRTFLSLQNRHIINLNAMPANNGVSDDTLRALETAPNMYLILSPDLNILTASDLYLEATATTRETIVGKYIFEAFPDNPELPEGDGVQNINASLQEVLHTKRPHYMSLQRYDVPDVTRPGMFIRRYWQPSHTPILDEQGQIQYIIQLANNVTEKVVTGMALAEGQVQQQRSLERVQVLNEELATSNEELRALNEEFHQTQESLQQLNEELEIRVYLRTEELAAANEEMMAANEELQTTNEELSSTQQQLERTIAAVEASHRRFRNMINSSPVAMLVHLGDNLILAEVNDAMLRVLGKDSSVKGKPLLEAVPELVGQPIIDTLYQTYRTGEERRVVEAPIMLIRDGQPYKGYYNLTYTALVEEGRITGVMQSAIDVTEQVNARESIADINVRLNIALDAGALGQTEVDLETGDMECNEQFKKCYGRKKEDYFNYSNLFNSILPEYRDHVRKQVTIAREQHTIYQADYQVAWPDGSIHWISAHGKARYDENGNADRMVGIIADITEQKKDEQRKNDFIGMVSHELKTPLTSIKGYVQMLQGKVNKADDGFYTHALNRANDQVKKMTAMINGFLDLSRLESGKIYIDKRSFDMAGLVHEVEEESNAIINSHKVLFAPVTETCIIADREKIGQVMSNFISNAVKYSPGGTTIQVACVITDKSVQVSVRDEGFGIKPEDQQKLFDRYYRVEGQHMQTISGFGIGLYLCAEIINRHEGKIWLESEPGKGSTFYFSLPVGK
jgi:PAS domain S-box-containing protein